MTAVITVTNDHHMTLGAKIRAARAEAGLSQTELVKLSGVPQSNLSKIEQEKQGVSSATYDKIMMAITEYLGHPPVTVGAVEGLYGIVARAQGRLARIDPMAKPKPVEFLAEGFLARRQVTMIAGQEGTGKSSVTLSLAVALAQGRGEACGMRLPGTKMRGLVLDAENIIVVDGFEPDGSIAQERAQRYGLTSENAESLSFFGAAGFDLDKDHDALDAAIGDMQANDAERIDFIICDSFTSLWFGNENSQSDTRRVCNKLMRLACKHNIAVLLIHHTNKAGDAYRGATSIGSTISAVFTFSAVMMKDPETGKKVRHPSLRFLAPYKCRAWGMPKSALLTVTGEGVIGQGLDHLADDMDLEDAEAIKGGGKSKDNADTEE